MSESIKMNKRIIGLDILRILLALMVICIHLIWGDKMLDSSASIGDMDFFFVPLYALCYPAVNTYVLITGYFSYAKKKTMSQIVRSLLKLWLSLLFAQLIGYVLVLSMHLESFSILVFVKHFFPLTRGIWWYMSVYFVLMLISPVLNGVLDQLSKRSYLIVIAVALFLCSILPFFTNHLSVLGMNQGSGGLLWFIVLYLTGGGIFKYLSVNSRSGHFKPGLTAIGEYLLLTLTLSLSSYFLDRTGLAGYSFYSYNSIIVYGQAVMLFLAFRQINFKGNRVSNAISFLAGLSLAAYIYNCQEDIIKHLCLFIQPFNYAEGAPLVLLFFAYVLGIYLAAIAIEYLRRKLFSLGNLENRILDIIQR